MLPLAVVNVARNDDERHAFLEGARDQVREGVSTCLCKTLSQRPIPQCQAGKGASEVKIGRMRECERHFITQSSGGWVAIGGSAREQDSRQASTLRLSGNAEAVLSQHSSVDSYFCNSASRCLISLSSSSVCWAIRSALRTSSSAPDAAAACSTNCRRLSRMIAMRSSSSGSEDELPLLIMLSQIKE